MFRPALAALSVAALLAACGDDEREVAEEPAAAPAPGSPAPEAPLATPAAPEEESSETVALAPEPATEDLATEDEEAEPGGAAALEEERASGAGEALTAATPAETPSEGAPPASAGAPATETSTGDAAATEEAGEGGAEILAAEEGDELIPLTPSAEENELRPLSPTEGGTEPAPEAPAEAAAGPVAESGGAAGDAAPRAQVETGSAPEEEVTPPAVGPQSPGETPRIRVGQAGDLDEYLLDPGGRPAYLFSTDTPAADGEPPVITCSPECQTIWPLVITEEPPQAGEGVDPSRLQWWEEGPVPGLVTYDGWPLYHFERDDPDAPPHGHGNQSYGGQWLLMSRVGSDGAQ